MPYFLSPIGNDQTVDTNGKPLVGGKIYTYLAGTSTPATTYTDSLGTVPQANPIVLDALGQPASPIWMEGGVALKFVIKTSAEVLQRTVDNVIGLNDPQETFTEWVSAGLVPTYVGATHFTVPGDETEVLQANRRIEYVLNSGTYYGHIFASSYDSGDDETTVTIVPDAMNLDATLSSFKYGFISADNTSIPQQYIIGAVDKVPSRGGHTGEDLSNDGTTTAWVRKGWEDRATNTILGAVDQGKRLKFTAAFTQTLTAGATLGDDYTVELFNASTGVVVLDADGTETFNTRVGAKQAFNLYPGERAVITWNGTAWDIFGRSSTVTIETRTLAAVASADFEGGFDDPEIANIRVEWVDTNSGDASLYFRLKKSGSYVTSATYSYGSLNTSTTVADQDGAANVAFIDPMCAGAFSRSNGRLNIPFPTSGLSQSGTFDVSSGGGTSSFMRIAGGYYQSGANAVQGVRAYSLASTLTGTFRIVGERF